MATKKTPVKPAVKKATAKKATAKALLAVPALVQAVYRLTEWAGSRAALARLVLGGTGRTGAASHWERRGLPQPVAMLMHAHGILDLKHTYPDVPMPMPRRKSFVIESVALPYIGKPLVGASPELLARSAGDPFAAS